MARTFRALTSFGWGQRIVREGDIVTGDDLVMRKHASLFEPVIVPGVEQATAAPGERRSIRIPRKET